MELLIRRCAVAASLGLALASSAAAAPAAESVGSAGMVAATTHSPSPFGSRPATPVRHTSRSTPTGLSAITQSHWAGYAATGGAYRTVRARWVQPTARCTRQYSAAVFWVGVDGIDNANVQQAGTGVYCDSGKPHYFAWHQLLPTQLVVQYYPTAPVRPGDVVRAKVTWTSPDHYVLTVANLTRGWTRTTSGDQEGARSSVEVIAEAPTDELGVVPLTDFGSVRFTGSTVDGAAFGALSPFKIHMATPSGVLLAETGALENGSAFTVTWKHA